MEGPLYAAEQIRIPSDLPDILKNYTKHIIRTQPKDLFEASAEYFTRLSQQRAKGLEPKKVNSIQLEAFYNKYYARDQTILLRKDIEDVCVALNISLAHCHDILRLGGWDGEKIPWFKFWALLAASASGSLLATLTTICNILGDDGKVPVQHIVEALSYLAEIDGEVDQASVHSVVRILMAQREYPADALLSLVQTSLRVKPKSGGSLPTPVNQGSIKSALDTPVPGKPVGGDSNADVDSVNNDRLRSAATNDSATLENLDTLASVSGSEASMLQAKPPQTTESIQLSRLGSAESEALDRLREQNMTTAGSLATSSQSRLASANDEGIAGDALAGSKSSVSPRPLDAERPSSREVFGGTTSETLPVRASAEEADPQHVGSEQQGDPPAAEIPSTLQPFEEEQQPMESSEATHTEAAENENVV